MANKDHFISPPQPALDTAMHMIGQFNPNNKADDPDGRPAAIHSAMAMGDHTGDYTQAIELSNLDIVEYSISDAKLARAKALSLFQKLAHEHPGLTSQLQKKLVDALQMPDPDSHFLSDILQSPLVTQKMRDDGFKDKVTALLDTDPTTFHDTRMRAFEAFLDARPGVSAAEIQKAGALPHLPKDALLMIHEKAPGISPEADAYARQVEVQKQIDSSQKSGAPDVLVHINTPDAGAPAPAPAVPTFPADVQPAQTPVAAAPAVAGTPTPGWPFPQIPHMEKVAIGATQSMDDFLIKQTQRALLNEGKKISKQGVNDDKAVDGKLGSDKSYTMDAFNTVQVSSGASQVNTADLTVATRMAFAKLSAMGVTVDDIKNSKGELLANTTRAIIDEAAKDHKKISDVDMDAVKAPPGTKPGSKKEL